MYIIWMWFVVGNLGEGGGGGWSQIKPIMCGNELRTYDVIPKLLKKEIEI